MHRERMVTDDFADLEEGDWGERHHEAGEDGSSDDLGLDVSHSLCLDEAIHRARQIFKSVDLLNRESTRV